MIILYEILFKSGKKGILKHFSFFLHRIFIEDVLFIFIKRGMERMKVNNKANGKQYLTP